jgi:hypothetical protein
VLAVLILPKKSPSLELIPLIRTDSWFVVLVPTIVTVSAKRDVPPIVRVPLADTFPAALIVAPVEPNPPPTSKLTNDELPNTVRFVPTLAVVVVVILPMFVIVPTVTAFEGVEPEIFKNALSAKPSKIGFE